MRNQKRLILRQLDSKLEPFAGTEKIQIPSKGWIHTIRAALNMTLEQLGRKIDITKQGAKKIEVSEASGSISIRSLKEIGKAMASGRGNDAEQLKEEVAALKSGLQDAEDGERTALEPLNELLMGLPNILSDDVPDGADEAANIEIR